MVDRIDKALAKLSAAERKKVKHILNLIKRGESESLDVRKLKGRQDVFRVRKGGLRIIFRHTKNATRILAIERRSNRTYKNF